MKNFIANVPLFIGLGIKFVGELFVSLSFKLHITLGTEAGQKLKELQAAADRVIAAIKEAKLQKATGDDSRKLADIIGGTNVRAFKPSDNN